MDTLEKLHLPKQASIFEKFIGYRSSYILFVLLYCFCWHFLCHVNKKCLLAQAFVYALLFTLPSRMTSSQNSKVDMNCLCSAIDTSVVFESFLFQSAVF